MESSNKSKGSESLNDVMYRRLKNRERQRRYRERKRLQTDVSKACGTTSSADPSQWQIISLPNSGMADQLVVTRVHCTRNWKKDARRAHSAKQEATSNGLSLTSNGHSLNGENHASEQTLKNEVPATNGAQLNDSDKVRSKPGRRAWKAEARKKQEVDRQP